MRILTAIIVYLSLTFTYAQEVPGTNVHEATIMKHNDTLYIIEGLPVTDEIFKKLNPDDIMSIKILKNKELDFSCYSPRDVVVVKTISSLTKREKRKLRRKNKKQQ